MSGDRYTINDQNAIYFLTFTVVDWVDVFTRAAHKLKIVESLKYCQKEKGLEIYAWVLMSNHMHLIVRAQLATCFASRHDPSAFGTLTLWNAQIHELYSPFKAHTNAKNP